MNDADIYAAQGFGQKTGAGGRPALLVVDFVNGFLDPAIFGGGNVAPAVEATVPVLAACRDAGLPIIFTRIVYAADGSDHGVWVEKAPGLAALTPEAHVTQVTDDLRPEPGEIIVDKRQASAFFGTGLADLLRARAVDGLIVTGCTTSGCVRASVVDAISHNFRVTVLTDCVGDRAIGPHEANLFDMGQKYADLATSADLPALLPG